MSSVDPPGPSVRRIPASDAGRRGVAQVRAALAGRPRSETQGLAERRAALERFAARGGSIPVEAVTLGGVPAERHTPPGANGRSAILHAHGGAYVLGSAASHRALSAAVSAAAGVTLYSVDYRLAPEHPYPAGRDDLVAAYAALAAEHEGVALFGDSAGGGLMISAACVIRDAGLPRPRALAVTSPWSDLELRGESLRSKAPLDPILTPEGLAEDAEHYAGAAGLAAASAVNGDLAGLPQTLIQVGDEEVLYDDALLLAERLAGAGVAVSLEVWEGMTHSWHAFRDAVPEAAQATTRLGAFLSAALRA